jgi:hypothetical protein
MACPACRQLDRDERLVREAVEERREGLRYALTDDDRRAVEVEEEELTALLQRMIERRLV